ncbi:acetyl-CoA carboxylase biotin carboxylase subunit family protein [Nonomuraea sp. NPDC049309]|uniref:ATP-grasp domain-containing protein n=1 Tax=Nonomuraea sp. NPDC049309 TaxID=3364350 RepID=UPI0037147390
MANILIINRRTDEFAEYDRYIDHDRHRVAYITVPGWRAPQEAYAVIRLESLDDAEAVMAAATRCHAALGSLDTVLALSELDVLAGARIRDLFGVPGLGEREMRRLRDKPAMKEAVRAAGLRVPDHALVRTPADVAAFAAGRDVMVKPRMGVGSVGCVRVPAGAAAPPLETCMEAEEFVPGPIWHVDGLMRAGARVLAKASRYIGTCYDLLRGRPLGSAVQSGPQADDVLRFAGACLKALDFETGAFHLEIIEAPDGLVFLEVGARVGGGPIPKVFRDVYGIDLFQEWIRLEMGEDVSPPALPEGVCSGFLMVPGRPGRRVTRISSLAGRIEHLYAETLALPGHEFTRDADVDRVADFHFRAPTPAAVEEAIAETLNAFDAAFA